MSQQPDELLKEGEDAAELEELEEIKKILAEKEPQESADRAAPTRKKKRKPWWRRLLKALLILLLVLLSLLIVAGITVTILYYQGKSSMLNYDDATIVFPQPEEAQSPDPSQEAPQDYILSYDDGKTVTYQGKKYVLNENVSALLFIGVDKNELEKNEQYGSGGEADCILLIGLDTVTGETKVVNISRDSYAQVDIYSANGKYLESRSTQLCRAFAFGDGQEQSCENVVKSVSRLLYGLPIQSYIAMDMQALGVANDAIGGVTLVPQGDIVERYYASYPAGEPVTLWGKDALRYVRSRDKSNIEGNLDRMSRQKQYITAFVEKALQETKSDITTLLSLYQAMSGYTYTDMSLADVTFLLTGFVSNGAQFDFSTITGTAELVGENAVYYLDQTSLYETVLKVYYTPVEE